MEDDMTAGARRANCSYLTREAKEQKTTREAVVTKPTYRDAGHSELSCSSEDDLTAMRMRGTQLNTNKKGGSLEDDLTTQRQSSN